LLYDALWSDIRKSVVEKLAAAFNASEAAAAAAGKSSGDVVKLDRIVPLVDVSGSMEGTPMEAAIALGILTSEINHPAFRDRIITFETLPRWVSLDHAATIADKVDVVKAAPWGGSTDVMKAFKLIADVITTHRLPREDVPDLIIFSDMQFNEADRRSSRTIYEQLKMLFHDVGVAICGQPYDAPRIVFWNLRGDTLGFPAAADTVNVQLLSGFSAALLELVLSGEPVESALMFSEEAPRQDPYATFRKAMDSEDYLPVREVLAKSNEGLLREYKI
jgi:hypothetical protein